MRFSSRVLRSKVAGYLTAVVGVIAMTAVCTALRAHVNGMTVALGMLLVVLFVAAAWGSGPALLASVLGALCFAYFFVHPIHTLAITNPRDWIALFAFLTTAITAGQLSERARRRELALRESEGNLTTAQKIAHIGSWHLDLPRNRLTWSDEVYRMFGKPKSALLTYEVFLETVHPEDREFVRHAWTNALQGAPYDVEHRILVGGELKWVREMAQLRFDKDGKAIEGNGTVQDITQRKLAEAALRKSAEEIRDLYNRAPCGYHSLDADGVIVRINDTELDWLGYARADVAGKMKFAELLAPESQARFWESFAPFLKTLEMRDLELELVRKDGTRLPVLVSATAVTDPDGNYVMSRATVYDITARKRAENEMRLVAHLQAVVAELGERALRHRSLSAVVDDATTQVASTLKVEFCKILEILPDRESLLLRSGVGWKPGYVGHATVGLGKESQAGYALAVDEPVIVEDLPSETRFRGTALLHEHGVVSGVSVVISTKEGPYGVLGAHTARRRTFSSSEVDFLQSVANVLGSAIERQRGEAELVRMNRAQRALSKCNQALVRATDESTLLRQVCDTVVDEAGYRFCWVGRAEHDEAKSMLPLAKAGFEAGYLNVVQATWADDERGRGPAGSCIRTRQAVVSRNIATDPHMAPWREEALRRGYASVASIPLLIDSDPFGALLIYASEPDIFGAEEVQLLSELASDLAFGIATLRTRAERNRAEEEIRQLNADLEDRVARRTAQLEAANAQIEQARERESEVGFRIQQTLLLDPPPRDISGLQVAALTVPSQRIAGDFYIFIKHQDQSLDVIVGDVMGKGIPAALLGAATKTQFLKALSSLLDRSKGREIPQPKEIVMLAHAAIVSDLIGLESFVTLSYVRLNPSRRRLDLVDCGHTGILRVRGQTGALEVLHGDNLPLGVREDEVYEQISIPLQSDDLLLLFSDGITEARNPARQIYGSERLEQCVRNNRSLAPDALVEAIRRAVISFSESDHLADDLTGVAIRVQEIGPPIARADMEFESDLVHLRRARQFVREFCRSLPGRSIDENGTCALELAVNEAASNIMKHAYHGRPGQWIRLELEAFPGRVFIRLRHLGDAFDPSSVRLPEMNASQESGFGVFLIAQSTDGVQYYRDERGRHCVELVKICK